MSDSENQMEMFTSIISSLAGPERMERDRPFVGQPHTTLGQRGSMQIVGMRARDLMDCYIRAVIFSYPVTDENGKDIQPNRELYDEAKKGQYALLNSNCLYRLVGDPDPVSIWQNMICEIEKMMGVFPHLPGRDKERVFRKVRQGVWLAESGIEIKLVDNLIETDERKFVAGYGLFVNNQMKYKAATLQEVLLFGNFSIEE